MQSVRPILAFPRASWMWPCSDSIGSCCSIASRTAVEPSGTGARPACFIRMSSVSSGASSSPDPCGGQWKLKIVRSAGAVTSETTVSIRFARSGSSSSR